MNNRSTKLSVDTQDFRAIANAAYREYWEEKHGVGAGGVFGDVAGVLARTQNWIEMFPVNEVLTTSILRGVGEAVQDVLLNKLEYLEDFCLSDGLVSGDIHNTEYGYVISLHASVFYLLNETKVAIGVDFTLPVYEWGNDAFLSQAIENTELRADLAAASYANLIHEAMESLPSSDDLDVVGELVSVFVAASEREYRSRFAYAPASWLKGYRDLRTSIQKGDSFAKYRALPTRFHLNQSVSYAVAKGILSVALRLLEERYQVSLDTVQTVTNGSGVQSNLQEPRESQTVFESCVEVLFTDSEGMQRMLSLTFKFPAGEWNDDDQIQPIIHATNHAIGELILSTRPSLVLVLEG